MTHLTDEELDALVQMLQQRDKSKHGYTGHPLYNRNGRQAAAVITALRAQLARREEMHDCAMKERDDATIYADEQKARADRAESDLTAQIEADAMAVSAWGTLSLADMDDGVKWQFDLPDQIAASLRAQPHNTAALDRVKAEVRVAAIREAADKLKGQGYNTAVCQILALLDKDGA